MAAISSDFSPENMFMDIDRNGNGIVTAAELQNWNVPAGSELNKAELVRAAEENGGDLDYHAFLDHIKRLKDRLETQEPTGGVDATEVIALYSVDEAQPEAQCTIGSAP